MNHSDEAARATWLCRRNRQTPNLYIRPLVVVALALDWTCLADIRIFVREHIIE